MIVAGPPRPRTPGDFLSAQKVTKKPLKKLRFLRIFLNDGGFCLRYDLAVSIFPTTSLGRWQSNLRHNSLDLRSSSLGSPPKARFFSRLPGLRHGAGGSALLAVYAWRTLCAVRQGLLPGLRHGAGETALRYGAPLSQGRTLCARFPPLHGLGLLTALTSTPGRPSHTAGTRWDAPHPAPQWSGPSSTAHTCSPGRAQPGPLSRRRPPPERR